MPVIGGPRDGARYIPQRSATRPSEFVLPTWVELDGVLYYRLIVKAGMAMIYGPLMRRPRTVKELESYEFPHRD